MGDLFFENFGAGEESPPPGVFTEDVMGFPVIFGDSLNPTGDSVRYAMLRCDSMSSAVKDESLRRALRDVFAKFALSVAPSPPRRLLILCLGNEKFCADSVGSETAKRIVSGKVGNGYAAIVKTGVPLSTGYHSAEIGAAMAKKLRCDLAVCIDSLAADKADSLYRMIQLTDSGVAPGSGVSRHSEELSRYSLGIPVISVGIPTVTRSEDGRIITLAAAEEEVRCGGALIAHALNGYLATGYDGE